MDVEQFKDDVRSGRIDSDWLVELVVILSGQLQRALRRIEELEKELGRRPPKLEEPFSLRAEEKRQEARGEEATEEKAETPRAEHDGGESRPAERTEKVFPEGITEDECHYSHTRPVWRLEHGRPVLVAYEIHRSG